MPHEILDVQNFSPVLPMQRHGVKRPTPAQRLGGEQVLFRRTASGPAYFAPRARWPCAFAERQGHRQVSNPVRRWPLNDLASWRGGIESNSDFLVGACSFILVRSVAEILDSRDLAEVIHANNDGTQRLCRNVTPAAGPKTIRPFCPAQNNLRTCVKCGVPGFASATADRLSGAWNCTSELSGRKPKGTTAP